MELRFIDDDIYTYVGTVLISINPFRMLPLYTPDVLDTCAPSLGQSYVCHTLSWCTSREGHREPGWAGDFFVASSWTMVRQSFERLKCVVRQSRLVAFHTDHASRASIRLAICESKFNRKPMGPDENSSAEAVASHTRDRT